MRKSIPGRSELLATNNAPHSARTFTGASRLMARRWPDRGDRARRWLQGLRIVQKRLHIIWVHLELDDMRTVEHLGREHVGRLVQR